MSRCLAAAEPAATPAKVAALDQTQSKQLHSGNPELRQAYAQLVLNEASVKRNEIRITGSMIIPAHSAAAGLSADAADAAPGVPSTYRSGDFRSGEIPPLLKHGAPDKAEFNP